MAIGELFNLQQVGRKKVYSAVNVEVRDMKFQTIYNITSPIDINKFGGCISSVFVVESANFKKGIQLRYKRVSNYNKRDSQEAFIIEKIDQGYKFDEIAEQLDISKSAVMTQLFRARSQLQTALTRESKIGKVL